MVKRTIKEEGVEYKIGPGGKIDKPVVRNADNTKFYKPPKLKSGDPLSKQVKDSSGDKMSNPKKPKGDWKKAMAEVSGDKPWDTKKVLEMVTLMQDVAKDIKKKSDIDSYLILIVFLISFLFFYFFFILALFYSNNKHKKIKKKMIF